MIRVLGTVDCCAVALDFHAAVVFLVQITDRVVIRGDENIVLRRGHGAVLTGQLDGAVVVDLDPLCVKLQVIVASRIVSTGGIFLVVGAHPVHELVSGPSERAVEDRNCIALDDLDRHLIMGLTVIDLVNQFDDRCVSLRLIVLIGDIGVRAVCAGDGNGALVLRSIDDDRAVGQELAAVRHTDHGAVRQSYAAALGDFDLALVVASGIELGGDIAVSAGGGVGILIVRIAVLTGNGDAAVRVDFVPLSVEGLGIVMGEFPRVIGLTKFSGAVGRLVPPAEQPARNLEGVALECRFELRVGVVAHILEHILACGAVVWFVGDGREILVICAPLGVQRDAGVDRLVLGIGHTAAEAAVVPAFKLRIRGVGEQAVRNLQLALLADLLLHIAGAVVGIIGDGNIGVGKCVGDLLVGIDVAAAIGQVDGAVLVDGGATGDDNIFLAVSRLGRVFRTGHGARVTRRVLGNRHAALCGVRTGVERGRGIGIGWLDDDVVAVTDLVALTRQDDRAVRTGVGDGQGRGLFSGCHRHSICAVDTRTGTSAIAILEHIGRCGVAVKGGDVDGICLARVGFDRLGRRQVVTVVLVLHSQLRLILGSLGGLVVVGHSCVRGETLQIQFVVGVLGGQLVRAAVRQGRAGGIDADERVACLFGRVKGRAAAAGGRVLDDLVGLVGAGVSTIQIHLRRDGDKVRFIIEVHSLRALRHSQMIGVCIACAEMVLVVQQVFRRADFQILTGDCRDGVLVELLSLFSLRTEVVVDGDCAGGLGNIHKVDLQRVSPDWHLIVLAVVILQCPAVKALCHGLVALAHAGILRGDRIESGDGVVANSAAIDYLVQFLVRSVQLGLVHCNEFHLSGHLFVVDGVLAWSARIHYTGGSRPEGFACVTVGGVGIANRTQVQRTIRSSGITIVFTSLCIEHGDDLIGTNFLQNEVGIARLHILEGMLILACCQFGEGVAHGLVGLKRMIL